MPICPVCKSEQHARKNGKCPQCGVAVELYDGEWYKAGDQSPPMQIILKFEKLVSESLSEFEPVVFRFPRKGSRFRTEVGIAKRLYDMADKDLGIALESLEILFSHPKFSWKTRDTLLTIQRDFLTAKAIAVSRRGRRNEEKQKEKEFLKGAEDRSYLFSKE